MKAALITDTHFGARNDSQQFLKFFDKFYTNEFFPYLEKNNIKTIFHLGDIVDRRKFINYVTLREFHRIFMKPCVDLGIKLHVIVGNHDIPYRNTNQLNAMTELFGHHYDAKNMMFYANPTDVKYDGVSISMIPWINSSNYTETMEFISKTKSQILFGHLEINGFEMYRGQQVNRGGMDTKPFEKFDMVCSGHFHHKSSKKNIHYLGNPYELTWNDYNDNRGFHIFDSSKRELTFIQNPYRIFYKVWYDDTNKTFEDFINSFNFDSYEDCYVKVIVQNKNNPYWFDIVMDKLYNINPANVNIVDDHRNIDQQSEEEIISEAEDTLTSLHKYVESMDTKVNKNELNNLFTSLYLEAQNMETT